VELEMNLPEAAKANGPAPVNARPRNWWWLVPPALALFYPQAVRALYESGRLLHRAAGPTDAVAWLATVLSVALVYSVPAVGIRVAYVLGRREKTSSSELLARRLAHLAVATPPLFVLIGVIFFLLHSPNSDSVFWLILWLTALAVGVWVIARQNRETPVLSAFNPIPLRMAHGSSALLIVVIFLGWHLLNHASAVFSADFDQAMMTTLRKWYRSGLVQPALVTLVLFQVASGAILWWRATAARGDLYKTLQTSTGAFLSAFIVSHLNAVFILGRAVTKVDTTFLWASGAPQGLLSDAWNVRLIPHYSLGVWFVITHMGLGLCSVMLAHGVAPLVAGRVAWAVGGVGVAFALVITVAQLRVHGPK